MFKRTIIYVTLICFVVCMQGCYSKHIIPTQELERKPEYKNVTIITIDGEVYEFDNVYVYDDYIEGYEEDSILVNLLLEEVRSVRVRRFDALKTAGLSVSILAILGLAFLYVLNIIYLSSI